MGSPVSLDFAFPLSTDDQSSFARGLEDGSPNLDMTISRGSQRKSGVPFGQNVTTRDKSNIDAVFDQDMLDQWSPAGLGPGQTGSSLSARPDTADMQQNASPLEDPKPPAWSELKTKAGKERKRLPLACIDCRRKKIKCSGEKPACKHCVKARVPCVYKNAARKAAPRTDYMAMLDKRLKRMEDRVIKMIPKEDLPDVALTGRSSVRPPVPGHPVKKEKAALLKQSTEDPFATEIQEWTHSKSSEQDLPAPYDRPQRDFETKLSTEGADALPTTPIQEHLAELFFDCVYGQSYLLLHKPSFMRRLKAGTVPPVLMLAVCAVSARFSTHPQVSTEPAFLRGEQWATAARNIVEKRHFEPNITILTVMLILGLHFFGTCEGGLSWSFGGQSMRMGYALQLHRELDHDPLGRAQAEREAASGKEVPELPELSFTDREIRRRLMWACYLMDVFNSSGTERPSFLNEEYIKIQLPIREKRFQHGTPGLTEDIEGHVTVPKNSLLQPEQAQAEAKANLGVASYVIRAVVVWKRIVQYLNLGGKERDPHPIWDPLSQFASLQRQIQQLKKQLPDTLRYTPENLAIHVSERLANQFLFLHIVIAQTSLFLHRFAIPTAPNVHRPYPPDTPKSFLAASATTVVEAASQVSKLLADSTGHTLTVPFAGYCAYTSATVHVWGIFSKHPRLEVSSRDNLRHNYRYLTRMKRYWGMFHYMAESVKDIYRLFAEAANQSEIKPTSDQSNLRGQSTVPGTALDMANSTDISRTASPTSGTAKTSNESQSDSNTPTTKSPANSPESATRPILQYGDWFDRYPHGVSENEWEATHHPYKKDAARGNDAVMSQKSDLQSVEEFFASLNPPSKAVAADKDRDAAAAAAARAGVNEEVTGRDKKIPRRRGKSVHENSHTNANATTGMVAATIPVQLQQPSSRQRAQQVGPTSGNKSYPHIPTSNPSTKSHFNALPGISLNTNTSDIDIPMSEYGSSSTEQRLQSQAGTGFDMGAMNSPSYFGNAGNFTTSLTPTAHQPSLEFEYDSPSMGSNPGSVTNQPGSQNQSHMNFNFNYTSALPHLDRQMVFGAYAGLDPSTSNGSSALNNPNNFDYWSTGWDNQTVGGSMDMDGLGAFDNLDMIGLDAGTLKNQSDRPVGVNAHNQAGSRQRSGKSRPSANIGNTMPGLDVGQSGQNISNGWMGSSAWFMPFNIDPPVMPGMEDFAQSEMLNQPGSDGDNGHHSHTGS